MGRNGIETGKVESFQNKIIKFLIRRITIQKNCEYNKTEHHILARRYTKSLEYRIGTYWKKWLYFFNFITYRRPMKKKIVYLFLSIFLDICNTNILIIIRELKNANFFRTIRKCNLNKNDRLSSFSLEQNQLSTRGNIDWDTTETTNALLTVGTILDR